MTTLEKLLAIILGLILALLAFPALAALAVLGFIGAIAACLLWPWLFPIVLIAAGVALVILGILALLL